VTDRVEVVRAEDASKGQKRAPLVADR